MPGQPRRRQAATQWVGGRGDGAVSALVPVPAPPARQLPWKLDALFFVSCPHDTTQMLTATCSMLTATCRVSPPLGAVQERTGALPLSRPALQRGRAPSLVASRPRLAHGEVAGQRQSAPVMRYPVGGSTTGRPVCLAMCRAPCLCARMRAVTPLHALHAGPGRPLAALSPLAAHQTLLTLPLHVPLPAAAAVRA